MLTFGLGVLVGAALGTAGAQLVTFVFVTLIVVVTAVFAAVASLLSSFFRH